MATPTNGYEYYSDLHNDFSEAYHIINQYVIDLYTLPKRFIEETGPTIDRFLKEYSVPGVPQAKDLPTRSLMDFIGQIDDFTRQTIRLFEDHKKHVNDCNAYMQKVFALRALHERGNVSEFSHQYVELTPDILDLHSGLKEIKGKADDMINRLERLENRWLRMKPVINT